VDDFGKPCFRVGQNTPTSPIDYLFAFFRPIGVSACSGGGNNGNKKGGINGNGKPETDFIGNGDIINKKQVLYPDTTINIKEPLNNIRNGNIQPTQVFKNKEGRLPLNSDPNYYTEYDVPTEGLNSRGAQRFVVGKNGDIWYTSTHYDEFIPINP